MSKAAPALKALLHGFIDYAGIFPPAKLPLDKAVANYSGYRAGENAWLLRWFVVDSAELPNVPSTLDGALALLGSSDDRRAATVETKGAIAAEHPVYCEVSPQNLDELDAVKKSGCFAKIRTGGVKPEAIPSLAEVASFILGCASRRLPFKATAGLHHPIRAEYPLTYEPDAPRGVMHGFLNVLMASAFAWHGDTDIEPILADMDAKSFEFDESSGRWRDRSLSLEQINDARTNFIHSVGTCSFEEPVHDLQKLGLL